VWCPPFPIIFSVDFVKFLGIPGKDHTFQQVEYMFI